MAAPKTTLYRYIDSMDGLGLKQKVKGKRAVLAMDNCPSQVDMRVFLHFRRTFWGHMY